MKFILSGICAFALTLYSAYSCHAQVNLPYTLNFTVDDPTNWADGITQDGDGGTSNINGLDIQIYAANASFVKLAGSTMIWRNASWFASPSFTGITAGPEVQVTLNGVPAMVIKSTNQANNFSLQAITLLDWGGTSPVIATYDNGVLIGTINVSLPVNGNSKTITQSGELTASKFNNVDEIRFYPQGGQTEFWIGMNNISLAAAVSLPVQLTYFKGSVQQDQSVLLQWETAQEQNADHFDIEQSTNGLHYAKVGEVGAKGNSDKPSNYQFVCPAFSGTGFFRLKQVDIDGKAVYSNIVLLQSNAASDLSIFPNPVKDIVTINSFSGKLKEIKIYSAGGSLLKQVTPNNNQAKLDLGSMTRGIYYLSINAGGKQIFKTIVLDCN